VRRGLLEPVDKSDRMFLRGLKARSDFNPRKFLITDRWLGGKLLWFPKLIIGKIFQN
jgi:hypothetical protein